MVSMALLVSYAQKDYTIDEIRNGWAKKSIAGVKDGNILTLLTAFNKTWRTAPATVLLAHPVTNENHEDAYAIVVDRPNGYVSAQELGDDGEDISACVWKRSNGHKLFAVVYTRCHGLYPERLPIFYDYNPAKGILTPEYNALAQFVPAYTADYGVDVVNIELPQHGKDVVVTEYLMGWYFSIKHTYSWNGMEPQWTSTTIENYDKMCKQYDAAYELPNKVQFSKYALYDFDEDRNPELWLSSENDEQQAIYAIKAETIQLVASTYYKTHLLFHTNVVGSAGSCGTGCFRAEYTVLEQSQPKYRVVDQQDYNYQKDEMVSTYYKNGQVMPQKAGEQFVHSLGEPQDLKPLMQRLR